MFFSLLKLCLSILLLALSVYYGGTVIFDFDGHLFEIHIALLIFLLLALLYAYAGICSIFGRIVNFFHGKPSHEKGLEQLQLAFSGLLLKDLALTEKSLKKAKKYLGDLPLLSWIEGHFMLARDDQHRAKAIFYQLSEREKGTAFGAYSICNMAIKDHSASDAINAIDSILKIYPNAHELAFQAIAISLRSGSFSGAKKYIPSIKNTRKGRLIEAIILAEEGVATADVNLFKRAFKLAPELSDNAMRYAEALVEDGEYKNAQKVLIESFSVANIRELYDRYICCGKNLSKTDELKLAEKIMNKIPDSWLVHFRFAEIALKNNMKRLAFKHFLSAYEKAPYDFIARKLEETSAILGESANPLFSKTVRFVWKCCHCGHEISKWRAVCDHCDWIGEYEYREICADEGAIIAVSSRNMIADNLM